MTVENQTPCQQFTANGSQATFAFNFEIEGKDNIEVRIDNRLKSKNDYSYDLITNSITFNAAPKINEVIEIKRNTSLDRSITYQTFNNSFRPEILNYDLDRIWRKLQELGYADWLLNQKIDKETADRVAADIYYFAQAMAYTNNRETEIRQYIEALVNNITGENFLPIQDTYIKTWNEQSQEHENKRMSKARLGQKLLYETPFLDIDKETHKYPQGGCKVGNSLFIKIATGVGVVGKSTESFIIAEYNFKTGELISETQPMQTLGHHELSGFIKDGKTYLVTSYEPSSDSLSRSGVGISVIEWKGKETTLADVKQVELLNTQQYIGFPAVDENGEYVYIINKKYGAANGSGLAKTAPMWNVEAFKLDDALNGHIVPKYNFNIKIPAGDGLPGSNALNGFAATKDYLYVVFGGAYGRAEIHKYTINGDFVEKILTAHSRAARPQSEIITEDLFLYNAEPEGIFVDQGKLYLIVAESWYGAAEFVKFDGKFYLARYGMIGKSPASHADHWVKVPFTPTHWTDYSPTTLYKGRDTTKGKFVRTVIEITLKDKNNYDLLMPDSVGNVPQMINNLADQVHIYGNLQTSNTLNFGQYDYQRQTFQRNLSITENGLKLFDTRYLGNLNDQSSGIESYHSSPSSLLRLIPDTDFSKDNVVLYGRYHSDEARTTEHPYLARLESNDKETAVFYRDGRFYNYSKNTNGIMTKFFHNGTEKFLFSSVNNKAQMATSENELWIGQSQNGVYHHSIIGFNLNTNAIYPPSDGTVYLGNRDLKWGQVNTKNIVLQPENNFNPVNNGELVIEATSNTQVTLKLKGSDGVIRSTTLTLS